MTFLAPNRFRNCILAAVIMLLLFGCASTKETGFNQKYEASKSWFKEKWQTVGAKFSSSEDEEPSNKPQSEASAAQKQTNCFEHRVKWSGETLSLIAKWYTGRYGNWKAIAKANPGLNPNRIAVGDIIHIPPEMMKTKKPLPRKVVSKTLPGYFAHTVTQPNEKISAIASWYTGDAENSKAIAEANPDIDTDFLLVGNEIYIPSTLLKTRKSMVARSNQISSVKLDSKPPATAANTATPPAAKPKKIQLFGPKQFSDQ
jgi:hypothetical protein